MCGIIAGISQIPGLGLQVWQGLSRLEYRGYDSFGIAYKEQGSPWSEVKRLGAPSEWLGSNQLSGLLTCALGHTRWATHGAVTLKNAHPHNWALGDYAFSLVHNGVVENLAHFTSLLAPDLHAALRSETDSEKILALIVQYVRQGYSVSEACIHVADLIEGSYAIILADLNTDRLWAIRKDLPLYVAQDPSLSAYIVSDLAALPETVTLAYALLDRGLIYAQRHVIFEGLSQSSPQYNIPVVHAFAQNNVEESRGLSHLEKEIMEQSSLLPRLRQLSLLEIPPGIEEIHFVACGSSFYAAQYAAQLLVHRKICPAIAFIASEFRDTPPMVTRKTLLIALSQSGETADVLGALRDQGSRYATKIALCNRPGAMIERLVDRTYPLEAGPEYSVASTKVFTAQLVQLFRFVSPIVPSPSYRSFQERLSQVLSSTTWQQWAKDFVHTPSILILARGALLPIAYEGALKLRELTYKQTHAMASGELKHDSLALIDNQSVVVLCVPNDDSLHKNLVAAQEVHARGGKLYVLLQEGCPPSALPLGAHYELIPSGASLDAAIFFTIPFQKIALYLAQILGYSVDRPRNLAKSVTVE